MNKGHAHILLVMKLLKCAKLALDANEAIDI